MTPRDELHAVANTIRAPFFCEHAAQFAAAPEASKPEAETPHVVYRVSKIINFSGGVFVFLLAINE